MSNVAIEARDLKKTYVTTRGVTRREHVERTALRGVDFDIAGGELFGLLGPNGAGCCSSSAASTSRSTGCRAGRR